MDEKKRFEGQIKVAANLYEEIDDPVLREKIATAYKASFQDDKGESAQLQRCYDDVSLETVLKDKSHLKILSQDGKGNIYACGSCLKIRGKEESKVCSISTMSDLLSMIERSDKVLVF